MSAHIKKKMCTFDRIKICVIFNNKTEFIFLWKVLK